MSWKETAAKIAELVEAQIVTRTRFEDLKDRFRELQATMKHIVTRYEDRHEGFERRLAVLEAQFQATYERVALTAIEGAVESLVQERTEERLADGKLAAERHVSDLLAEKRRRD